MHSWKGSEVRVRETARSGIGFLAEMKTNPVKYISREDSFQAQVFKNCVTDCLFVCLLITTPCLAVFRL